MHRDCTQCGTVFVITDDDLAFLEKVSPVFGGKKELIPPPTLCPDCRQQRRMAYRNQIHVYMRPSSMTGLSMFSMFDEGAPMTVMEADAWWGDAWEAPASEMQPDLSGSFFAQLSALRLRSPCYSRSIDGLENSDYTNNASHLKNCYFVFDAQYDEDCLYCDMLDWSRDCMDCTRTLHSELCFDCTACLRCYSLQSSYGCVNCKQSMFLWNCIDCADCFGCVNLFHRQYCFFNEQLTAEEYARRLQHIRLSSLSERAAMHRQWTNLVDASPHPHIKRNLSENITGNYIVESRNIATSYLIVKSEDLQRCFNVRGSKDCAEFTTFGNATELVYESASCGNNAQRVRCCYECFDSTSDLLYCMHCTGCSDCFGCVGLKKKRYCILNKQYTKEEYIALVPKIIAQMRETGEWGEFFPLSMSPYAYNHTIAQRYYPRTREQVEAMGGRWLEETMPEAAQAIEASELPDGLPETDDPIIVRSERSGRPFKITSREIKRYRQFQVPLPRLTYDERMEDQAKILGGITLYDRTCAKTGKPIKTTIPPESPWIVWEREEWENEYGS